MAVLVAATLAVGLVGAQPSTPTPMGQGGEVEQQQHALAKSFVDCESRTVEFRVPGDRHYLASLTTIELTPSATKTTTQRATLTGNFTAAFDDEVDIVVAYTKLDMYGDGEPVWSMEFC